MPNSQKCYLNSYSLGQPMFYIFTMTLIKAAEKCLFTFSVDLGSSNLLMCK